MTACNWQELVLETPSHSDREAYVGLREKNTLRVPHGYPTGKEVKEKPKIFGEITRAIARFSEARSNLARSSYEQRSTRDGFLKDDGGQSLSPTSTTPDFSYSHLSLYVQLIRQLRDPHILAITKASGLTAQFDHRYISRNLERAMFLPDGTPVFENLWAPRTHMRHTGNDMVGLACWMALDGLNHLFPDSAEHEISAGLQSEWEELAHRFADDHELDVEASLFSKNREATLHLLQAALEACIRIAPPVSADSRELHHLLDLLLHSTLAEQDGDIWGLKGFHHVWEAACLEYAIGKYGARNVFTCDQKYWLGLVPPEWEWNWSRIFGEDGLVRKPDLVVKTHGDGPLPTYLIIDFKYYAEDDVRSKFLGKHPPSRPDLKLLRNDANKFELKWKSYQDIASVEAYRWRLMQHELKSADASQVKIELWFPVDEYKLPCVHHSKWMSGLTLVGKPARQIIAAYSKKFRLMA